MSNDDQLETVIEQIEQYIADLRHNSERRSRASFDTGTADQIANELERMFVGRVEKMSDEEWEYTFDAINDVAERWGITPEDAEAFLEKVGYFSTERYREVAEYFDPVEVC